MSNEFQIASDKLDDLISHKELQELQLMKLKCDIREQKGLLNKLKKERIQKNNEVNPRPLENIDFLIEKPKTQKPKSKVKKDC